MNKIIIVDTKENPSEFSIEYVKINENLQWVDDMNSEHYNQLVDITKVGVDWKSAQLFQEKK